MSFFQVKESRFSLTSLSLLAGKDQAVKLSLPRASSLNENVDHSALLKLGATVSERVNRFDSKPGGEGGGAGLSKLQETRRIFEQRTLQVSRLFCFSYSYALIEDLLTDRLIVSSRRSRPPPTGSC